MIDQTLRDKLADAYVAAIPLITLNLVWFVCCIPIVTIIPATAALFYATNRLAHGRDADWHTFVEGFRLYFWRSWLWGLMNVVVVVILVSNLFFYSMNAADWTIAARAVVGALTLIWLMLQIHTFPLIIEQEHPRLLLALRNSFVILTKRPLHTVGTAIVVGALVVASTGLVQPAWIFITASLSVYLANRVTLSSIAKITGKPVDETVSDPGYRVGE